MTISQHSKTEVTLSVIVCGAIALAGCSSSGGKKTSASSNASIGTALASGENLAMVCTNAASEGAVNVRSTTDPALFAKEIADFAAKYPSVKVSYGSQRPADSVSVIVAEKQTKHAIDVDAIAIDFPSAGPMIKQDLVQQVDWKALGVPAADVLEAQGTQFVRTQRIILGLGYNTTKLSASDLPDTWDQLIDSKWAGKIIVDPRGEYLSGLGIAWGQEKATAWYKKFLKTDKPQVVKGATTSIQKVISGEALLTTSSHDSEIVEQEHKGAPVAIKYLDVVPTQDHYAIIVQGAPHPNAAACFLGWWLTKDGGQAAQLKYEFKGNDEKPTAVPATSQLAAITNAGQADLQASVAEEFAKLTGS